MTVPLMWAIVLLLLGLALVVLEAFIPSGGILGALAVLSVVSSVVLAFYSGPATGMFFLVTAIVAVPALLAMVFNWWPNTPIGRRLLLTVPDEDEVKPNDPQREILKALVGKVGVAKSVMLPSGPVLIQGRTIDALSEGVAIESGQHVEVVEVRGVRVVVRATNAPVSEMPRPKSSSSEEEEDLSQPIDSLGIDPFEDTPA